MLVIKKFMLVLLILSMPISIMAAQTSDSDEIKVNSVRLDIDQSSIVIKNILSLKEFQTSEKRLNWKFNYDFEEDEVEDTNELWGKLLLVLARGVELTLWLIPVVILIVIIYYRKYWMVYLKSADHEKEIPLDDPSSGVTLKPDPLPENITQSAMTLWHSGAAREALSLLFRASVIKIVEDNNINLTNNLTEYECIKKIRQTATINDRTSYFERIANIWIKMAYGHIRPKQDEFEKLCSSWDSCFEMSMHR